MLADQKPTPRPANPTKTLLVALELQVAKANPQMLKALLATRLALMISYHWKPPLTYQ